MVSLNLLLKVVLIIDSELINSKDAFPLDNNAFVISGMIYKCFIQI